MFIIIVIVKQYGQFGHYVKFNMSKLAIVNNHPHGHL
jgi:hypothetical protein